MKKILYISSFLLFSVLSCKNADQDAGSSENDVDAARNFIQSALEGNYDKATTYMLRDSVNMERMNDIKRVNLSPEEKRGLASASINIHNISRQDDSTTIVIYSNSFKNNWDTLKVIKDEGKWLVDFKYLFERPTDTMPAQIKDTLR